MYLELSLTYNKAVLTLLGDVFLPARRSLSGTRIAKTKHSL